MADIVRRAEARWDGNLIGGGGSFTVGSGALGEQAISWVARTEAPGGNTSPEELIAASHASCYAMAFSHTLAEAGSPPRRLWFQPKYRSFRSRKAVSAWVPAT